MRLLLLVGTEPGNPCGGGGGHGCKHAGGGGDLSTSTPTVIYPQTDRETC